MADQLAFNGMDAKPKSKKAPPLSVKWVIGRLQEEAAIATNAHSRVKALELLGKHLGMWEPKPMESDPIKVEVVYVNAPIAS